MEPELGRIVLYKPTDSPYIVPAIITATVETTWAEGIERADCPSITQPDRVHLTILTPSEDISYQAFDVLIVNEALDATAGTCWYPEGTAA